jgi:hypothetical protein
LATEIATYPAQLPSKQVRDDYLRERRRALVTSAQAEDATSRDAAIVANACVGAPDQDRAFSAPRGRLKPERCADPILLAPFSSR